MKKTTFFLSFLLLFTSLNAQNPEKWERWAENLAERADQLAENVERKAELNAERWAVAAERFAENVEDRFNDQDFDVFPRSVRIQWCPDAAYLGIQSQTLPSSKAEKLGFQNKYGSYVTKVIPNSAAEDAGLQPFDYIIGIDEQRTSNNQDLADILADYKAGDEAVLHFIRRGKLETARVTFGENEEFGWTVDQQKTKAFLGVRMTEQDNAEDLEGVAIEVVRGSTAETIGLEDGDIITAINGNPILDWDDITIAVQLMDPGDEVEVTFLRDGRSETGKGVISARKEQLSKNSDSSWAETFDVDIFDKEGSSGQDRAFLGIYAEYLSEEKARKLGFDNPYGSYVTGVLDNTAAKEAGIMPFDYIYGIDEYRVGDKQRLTGILKKYEPGDKAEIHFYRKQKKTSKTVTFKSHYDSKEVKRNKCEDPFFGIIQIDSDGRGEGVKVKPVKNSTAINIGIESGDVITHINDYPMIDWNDISTAIDMLTPGETIRVALLRDGKNVKKSGKITSYAEAKKCDDCDCGDIKDIVINVDPDIQIDLPWEDRDRERDRSREENRVDINNVGITMEKVSEGDLNDLKSKGLDLNTTNTLVVERVKMSPDPTAGMFRLEFNLPSEGNTTVRVYNPVGRTIYEYDLGRFSGNFSDDVDVSQNGPGTYYLQIRQNGQSFTRKIVLTKS